MDNQYSRYTTGPDPRKTYIKSGINLAPGAISCWFLLAAGIYWALQYIPNPFAR